MFPHYSGDGGGDQDQRDAVHSPQKSSGQGEITIILINKMIKRNINSSSATGQKRNFGQKLSKFNQYCAQ